MRKKQIAVMASALEQFVNNVRTLSKQGNFRELSDMVGAPARVYTGEVTQPHLRGMLDRFCKYRGQLPVF